MSMTEEYDRKEKLAEKQAELEAQYGDTKSESKNTPATPR